MDLEDLGLSLYNLLVYPDLDIYYQRNSAFAIYHTNPD